MRLRTFIPILVVSLPALALPFFSQRALTAAEDDIVKLEWQDGQAAVAASLTAADRRDWVRRNSYCKVYSLELQGGQLYQIDMIRKTPGLDPYLRLEDARGKNAAEDDDSGGDRNARIVYRAERDGTYYIVATAFLGETGDFKLTVRRRIEEAAAPPRSAPPAPPPTPPPAPPPTPPPAPPAPAEEAPLVERYLHSGELARGELALETALAAHPKDDQVRFGLGVLLFVRGVERFGQALHQYGARSENTNVPFLRLPVPNNPDPDPISYAAFRRILDDFDRDLAAAEATLAGVTDENVKLPLRLAHVRLDLTGDGKANEKLLDVMKKVMQRQRFDFLESNPDFLVCFDRGDVAWLRAYCHLLMAMLDCYLAFDTEPEFGQWAGDLFAKPKYRGGEADRRQNVQEAVKEVVVTEPARLGRFRKHLMAVAELNRETWKYIRAETDDDHEWLPNPKQKGVLGLPVRDEMIDAWLAMMGELEALLDGKRVLPKVGVLSKNGKGLNLKTLLDDPPEKLVADGLPQNLPDRYWSDAQVVNVQVLMRVVQIFGDPSTVGYAAWFN